MAIGSEWLNRLLHLGRRTRFDDELDDEIRFHIETRVRALEAEGLSASAALIQARREFGSVALVREDSRAAWQFRWLADFAGDLRYCLRAFRRTPVFALTAVLSLALGIGANSAIFTALDAVLWRPLPVTAPEQLVQFAISRTKLPDETDVPADFVPQLRKSGIFAGVTVTGGDGLSFTYDGRAERIIGEMVSPDYFALLGVQPVLGQAFTPGVRAGHWAAEAVLSYTFWQRRFGGDPSVIGRTIHLNTYPFTITGVSAPGFFGVVRASTTSFASRGCRKAANWRSWSRSVDVPTDGCTSSGGCVPATLSSRRRLRRTRNFSSGCGLLRSTAFEKPVWSTSALFLAAAAITSTSIRSMRPCISCWFWQESCF